MGRKIAPLYLVAASLGLALVSVGAAPLYAQAAPPPPPVAVSGTPVSFTVDDVTVTAIMPCTSPVLAPESTDEAGSSVCLQNQQIFVFVSAVGSGVRFGPMGSDFDEAYEEIGDSPDTIGLTQEVIDGRRILTAGRGPDPDFGLVRAVELREDAVVYVVAMTEPGSRVALSDDERAVMAAFVESLSLEVAP